MPFPPVVINSRAAARAEIGGVERVAREMVSRLPRLAPERYRVTCPRTRLGEQARLPLTKAELIYSPANLAPVASRRNVVVIHDAAALRHPEWYSRPYVAWQRFALPRIAKNARLVITVSEFSKREIAETMGANAIVVPNGVDHERFKPVGDKGDYALVVGTRITRKNLASLEAASKALVDKGVALVAAGSGRSYMRSETTSIRQLGYVPDDELPSLYARARLLLMPSLYEGFGLPVLEAMASGTPVVAANRGALPETCGDAALVVEPHEFADAALQALEDSDRLTRAGLERAARFTWERTARETDQAIGRLLTSR